MGFWYAVNFLPQDTNSLEYLTPKKTSLRHRLPMGDQGFIEFVSYLLAVNPERRPTASEALNHPWLSFPYEPISSWNNGRNVDKRAVMTQNGQFPLSSIILVRLLKEFENFSAMCLHCESSSACFFWVNGRAKRESGSCNYCPCCAMILRLSRVFRWHFYLISVWF